MYKSLILILAFALNAAAAESTGRVWVPELDKYVVVKKESATKEFVMDYRDLAEVGFKLSEPFDTSKCGEWRRAVRIGEGNLEPSFFQQVQLRLELQVFKTAPHAVTKAMGSGWTDAGSFEISKSVFQYEWNKKALSLLAGRKVTASIQQEIENSLNSTAAHLSIRDTGRVAFTVTNALFACDLLENYVSLDLNVDIAQFSSFRQPAIMRANDISEISRRVVEHSEAFKPENGEPQRSVNAAGLLGFQLRQQGYGAEVFRSGEFLKLYSKVFEQGPARPSSLSSEAAADLVKSMGRTKLDTKTLNISQRLSLE